MISYLLVTQQTVRFKRHKTVNELTTEGLNQPSGMRHPGRTSHCIAQASSSAGPQSKLRGEQMYQNECSSSRDPYLLQKHTHEKFTAA